MSATLWRIHFMVMLQESGSGVARAFVQEKYPAAKGRAVTAPRKMPEIDAPKIRGPASCVPSGWGLRQGELQVAVARNMEATLNVPVFRVARRIKTDK